MPKRKAVNDQSERRKSIRLQGLEDNAKKLPTGKDEEKKIKKEQKKLKGKKVMNERKKIKEKVDNDLNKIIDEDCMLLSELPLKNVEAVFDFEKKILSNKKARESFVSRKFFGHPLTVMCQTNNSNKCF